MKFKSQSQAKHFYDSYKKGEISYTELMKHVHESGDLAKLPERVTEKKVDKKTATAIKGLI